ncbi:MAG: nitronate monooxygenase [Actinomycetota bacterium]|jgi:nitronate monooxygenase
MIRTRLTELVGCTLPIQQAPMGTVSSPRLAVAVAEAGGIGSINTLAMSRETLRRRLDEMREQTAGVLAVSFLTNDIDVDAITDGAARAQLIDFFWSDPRPDLVDIAHRGGALVNWQVGSRQEALAAVRAGADIICVQGVEAGGHCRGDSPLLPLLCEVLDAVDVPVLAAGGIADARGVAAVIAAGASGVRMGTRFIATDESAAHADYKAAVVAAGANSTRITDAFNDCPLCASAPRARVLVSAIDAVQAIDVDVVGTMQGVDGELPVPRRSWVPPTEDVSGHVGAMAMYAGESVALVNDVVPAAQLVRSLAEGAEALLGQARPS